MRQCNQTTDELAKVIIICTVITLSYSFFTSCRSTPAVVSFTNDRLLVSGEESPEGYLKFIKDQFLLHKPGHKQAYIHVSTAIDIAGMRQVLTNVVDIIVEINLRRAGTY